MYQLLKKQYCYLILSKKKIPVRAGGTEFLFKQTNVNIAPNGEIGHNVYSGGNYSHVAYEKKKSLFKSFKMIPGL